MEPPASREKWIVARDAYVNGASAISIPQPGDISAERATAHARALDQLIATPSPDHEALKVKLETLSAEYFSVDNALTKPNQGFIIADVCRLGGLAVPS